MAGKYQGAAALIQKDFPKATYFHCAAHALNLCVVAACKIPSIMVGTLEQICLFFIMSPKRHDKLAHHISNMPEFATNHTKLVNICKTRWVARIESFEVFLSLVAAVAELKFPVIPTHGIVNQARKLLLYCCLLCRLSFSYL